MQKEKKRLKVDSWVLTSEEAKNKNGEGREDEAKKKEEEMTEQGLMRRVSVKEKGLYRQRGQAMLSMRGHPNSGQRGKSLRKGKSK